MARRGGDKIHNRKKEPHKFSKLNKDNIKKANYTKMIFELLLPKQKSVIRNSMNLLDSYGLNYNPEQNNPSTTIHKLVQILNNIK